MSEWIKHDGAECPVSEGDIVDIRYRDGSGFSKLRITSEQTHGSVWSHVEGDDGKRWSDIVEYRIH